MITEEDLTRAIQRKKIAAGLSPARSREPACLLRALLPQLISGVLEEAEETGSRENLGLLHIFLFLYREAGGRLFLKTPQSPGVQPIRDAIIDALIESLETDVDEMAERILSQNTEYKKAALL